MSEPPGPLRRAWERRKARAFPPGALTFHLAAFTRRRLTREGVGPVGALRALHGFDDLFLLHGSALLANGAVTLVTGPPGIGKSTTLRRLEDSGLGRLVEDGLLVVGTGKGGCRLVETGTLDVMVRASRIGSRLRRLLAAKRRGGTEELRGLDRLRDAAFRRVPAVSFSLATSFGRRPRAAFTPTAHGVRAAVAVPQPGDPAPPLRIRADGDLEELGGLDLLARGGVAVVLVPAGDGLTALRARLAAAIRETVEGRGGSYLLRV